MQAGYEAMLCGIQYGPKAAYHSAIIDDMRVCEYPGKGFNCCGRAIPNSHYPRLIFSLGSPEKEHNRFVDDSLQFGCAIPPPNI